MRFFEFYKFYITGNKRILNEDVQGYTKLKMNKNYHGWCLSTVVVCRSPNNAAVGQ